MSGRRPDPFDAPADKFLWALRRANCEYRCTPSPHAWEAVCAACRGGATGARTLEVRERGPGGPVSLRCSHGCTEGDLYAALDPGLGERILWLLVHAVARQREHLLAERAALPRPVEETA